MEKDQTAKDDTNIKPDTDHFNIERALYGKLIPYATTTVPGVQYFMDTDEEKSKADITLSKVKPLGHRPKAAFGHPSVSMYL
ncbi:hypothetical protein L1987_32908 [Smallanthus sonchifolius]|uniref:Uncharacterized protein n=1 Tax=Smallanthus sonchifolius TaxID=185202 RepID=A0ACB9HPB5_9ASTR|nr:hypothetical protein L1987_32908 [Smallanthus sonchifolius]